MRIEHRSNKNTLNFDDLETGEVFTYNGVYYIKILKVGGINSIDLSNGANRSIARNTEVVYLSEAILSIGE